MYSGLVWKKSKEHFGKWLSQKYLNFHRDEGRSSFAGRRLLPIGINQAVCVNITGLSCSRMNAQRDASRGGFFIFTSPLWQRWLVVTLIKVGARHTSRYMYSVTDLYLKQGTDHYKIKQSLVQNVQTRVVYGLVLRNIRRPFLFLVWFFNYQ